MRDTNSAIIVCLFILASFFLLAFFIFQSLLVVLSWGVWFSGFSGSKKPAFGLVLVYEWLQFSAVRFQNSKLAVYYLERMNLISLSIYCFLHISNTAKHKQKGKENFKCDATELRFHIYQ